MSKRVVISGYYGFGNTGDEAVLSGILATIRELEIDARVVVLSSDPEKTSRDHRVDAVHRYRAGAFTAIRKADVVISGGGSLLQDATSARSIYYYLFVLRLAQAMGKKTMVYAQGIGPLVRPSVRKHVAKVLGGTDVITIRDADSKALIEEIGVKKAASVVADPSFVVEADYGHADEVLSRHGLSGQQLIGVSLRPFAGEWLAEAAEGIAAAAEEIGLKIVLLPMQPGEDVAICRAVKGGVMIDEPLDVRTMKGVIGRCGLVVGMRLHSLIFAAGEGVPFVPISYDPKVDSFAEAMGAERSVDVRTMSAEKLRESILDEWTRRDAAAKSLSDRETALRDQALEAGHELARLLDRAD